MSVADWSGRTSVAGPALSWLVRVAVPVVAAPAGSVGSSSAMSSAAGQGRAPSVTSAW